MTAYQNIAFPLKAMKYKREKVKEEVGMVADLLRIGNILELKPSHLSGGDLQRVALARALVIRPKVFLLDEPLSTLDAEFREEARTMIKRIHMDIGSTTIYVTHDQMEAMAIADRIVTMNFGEIQQVETPENIYHNPTNMFVANFIGSPGMNFVDCSMESKNTLSLGLNGKTLKVSDAISKKIHSVGKESDLVMGVRPEDFTLSTAKHEFGFPMEVNIVEELGPENIVNLRSGDHILKVLTDPNVRPKSGDTVWAVPDQKRIRIFDKQTHIEIL
jgi:ABC-type sugar transport system ATPase subunit